MKHTLYLHYLKIIVKEAIDNSDGTAAGAADYLTRMKKPGFLSKPEKREAFYRAQKVFTTTRDRPLWFVLSCLGLKQEDLEDIS